MDAVIRVEPMAAESTVTNPVVIVALSQKLDNIVWRLESVQAPLILQFLSIGGCSVAAIPNPNLFAKEGELAVAA